jgi:hypothetical protein
MAGLAGMTPIQRIKAIQGNNALALELPGNMRTASQPRASNLVSGEYGLNTTVPTVANTQTNGLATAPQGATGWQATANKYLGTGFGNKRGLEGNNYMFTNTDGTQGSLAIDPQYLQGAEGAAVYDAINNPTQGSEGSGAGGMGDYMGLANLGVNAFNAYNNYTLGRENLKMARDKFGFEKAATTANYANQAKLANNQIQNAGEVGMGLAGNTMDATARAARQAQMDASKVRETI